MVKTRHDRRRAEMSIASHVKRCLVPVAVAAYVAVGIAPAAIANNSATLKVTFKESAPKDSFAIENVGACAAGPFTLAIDLAPSAGKLYFDTTASGAGLQVFQPFELTDGRERVTAAVKVSDGQQVVRLPISGLPPGARVAFTVDVDDNLPNGPRGQTQIDGSEMTGAVVRVTPASGSSTQARMSADNVAELGISCVSS